MPSNIYKKYTALELINILSQYNSNTPVKIHAVYDSFMLAGGEVFAIQENKNRKNGKQVLSISLLASEEQLTDEELLERKLKQEKLNKIQKILNDIQNKMDCIDDNNDFILGLTNHSKQYLRLRYWYDKLEVLQENISK